MTASTPLFEKLKEISILSEAVDEEEDKRRFFARLEGDAPDNAQATLGRPGSQDRSHPEHSPGPAQDAAGQTARSASDGSDGGDLSAYLGPKLGEGVERQEQRAGDSQEEGQEPPLWKLAFSANTATLTVDSGAGGAPRRSLGDSLELPRSIVLQGGADAPATEQAGAAGKPAAAGRLDGSLASTASASSSGSARSCSLHDMLQEARHQLDEQVQNARVASDNPDTAEREPARSSTPTISPPRSVGANADEGGRDGQPGPSNTDSPARGVWEKSRTDGWRPVPASPDSVAEPAPTVQAPAPRPATPGTPLLHSSASRSQSSAENSPAGSPAPAGGAVARRQGTPHAKLLKSRLPIRSPRHSPQAKSGSPGSPARSPAKQPATNSSPARPPRSPARTANVRDSDEAESEVEALKKLLAASEATKKVLRTELSMSRSSANSNGGAGKAEDDSDGEMAAILKQRVLEGGTLDGVTRDEMRAMERLVDEQEHMINAYQRENEKTCRELRHAKARVEELEAILKERGAGYQPDGAAATAPPPPPPAAVDADGASPESAAELAARLAQVQALAQERELELKHELDRVRSAKRTAEAHFAGVDIPSLQREGEKLREVERQLVRAEDRHKEEVARLQKQIKWYVENQEIIDAADNLVATQKEKIAQLEEELSSRPKGGKGKGKKGTGLGSRSEAARVKELETQVGTLKAELEEVLRKKHPNSLPQLIRAARPPIEENAAHAFLQQRVKSLEETLAEKEDEHAKRFRALRQGFERVKSQHETRLAELEVELAAKKKQLDVERKPHQRIKELERQLDDTRAFHTKKLRELNGKLQASARQQEKAQRKHSKDPKGSGAAPLRQKVKRLEGDLAKACDEIRRLQEEQQDTEDRLKEETARVRELSRPSDTADRPSTPVAQHSAAQKEHAAVQGTPPQSAAERIAAAAGRQSVELSPPFDAPQPPPRPTAPSQPAVLDPHHPLHGMDTVQSLLGMSPAAAPQDQAGTVSVSAHEVQQLRAELQKQQAYINVKNDEILSLGQRLAQKEAELNQQKLLVAKLQAAGQADESSPEMQRYKQLESQVATIIQRYDGREAALRQNLRRTHETLEHELSATKQQLQHVTTTKNAQLAQFRTEMDTLLTELGNLEEHSERGQSRRRRSTRNSRHADAVALSAEEVSAGESEAKDKQEALAHNSSLMSDDLRLLAALN